MEVLYHVSEKRGSDDVQLSGLRDEGSQCAVSSQSVLAFTRVVTKQDVFKHRILVYSVCVAELNTPYEVHEILECGNRIIHLQFNDSGSQLLVVDSEGTVHLFNNGAGLHEWNSIYKGVWAGESILNINFFHQGLKVTLNSNDVKLNMLYSEKFIVTPHKPTLFGIGKCPRKGYFAITASGLILICVLAHDGSVWEESKVVLGQTRDNFTSATTAMAPSGQIHVAAWKPGMVKCWRVELSQTSTDNKEILSVDVQAAPSFCPKRITSTWNTQPSSDSRVRVTALRYAEVEDPNSLLVALTVLRPGPETPSRSPADGHSQSSRNGGTELATHMVHLYQLQDQQRPLLQLFMPQGDAVANTPVTKEWVCMAKWVSNSEVVCLGAAPRHLLPGGQIPFVVTAATVDGCLYALNRDTLQQMSFFNLHHLRSSSDDPPLTKRSMWERRMSCLAHTWTGFSMIATDNNGSIYFLTLLRQPDVGHAWPMYVMLLLELAVLGGYDWWDLLIAAPTNSILTLAERLSENFFQHHISLTQHLHIRFLIMKTSLLRLSSTLHQRAVEARVQAQLVAIQQLFRSLRPVTCDVSTSDKNITSTIQSYMENRASLEQLDIEKSVEQFFNSVNMKDCEVDSSLLQTLQPLLQFVADLSLFLLYSLTHNSKYELARDTKTIQCLREVLFVSRLWYRQNKLIVPQMCRKTENVDVWAQIYKLLTRLVQILPGEPDANYIDECVLLETQVVCREIPLHFPTRGILAAMSSAGQQSPQQYEFGHVEASNSNVLIPASRSMDGLVPPVHNLDPLQYHYLGARQAKLQCTRCWSVRGGWWGGRDSAWEQQWESTCLCSGHWAPAPHTPPKAA